MMLDYAIDACRCFSSLDKMHMFFRPFLWRFVRASRCLMPRHAFAADFYADYATARETASGNIGINGAWYYMAWHCLGNYGGTASGGA